MVFIADRRGLKPGSSGPKPAERALRDENRGREKKVRGSKDGCRGLDATSRFRQPGNRGFHFPRQRAPTAASTDQTPVWCSRFAVCVFQTALCMRRTWLCGAGDARFVTASCVRLRTSSDRGSGSVVCGLTLAECGGGSSECSTRSSERISTSSLCCTAASLRGCGSFVCIPRTGNRGSWGTGSGRSPSVCDMEAGLMDSRRRLITSRCVTSISHSSRPAPSCLVLPHGRKQTHVQRQAEGSWQCQVRQPLSVLGVH